MNTDHISESNFQHVLSDSRAADTFSDVVEFRVTLPGSPVRRLRLSGNRYTFGTATSCSVQLQDSSLRPMHAVLIRDAHRILVRAYSMPIEINGNRTTESTLHIGDVMNIGNYSFELLAAPERRSRSPLSATPPDTQIPSPPIQPEPDQTHQRLVQDLEQRVRDREREVERRSDVLRERESHLLAQESAIIEIRQEYVNKQQELENLRAESQQREQQFELQLDDLRRQEHQQQHLALTSQEEATRVQLDSLRSASEQRETELVSELDALRSQQATLETEIQEQQARYSELEDEYKRQVDDAKQQVETTSDAIQRLRDQVASINGQLADSEQKRAQAETDRDAAVLQSEEQQSRQNVLSEQLEQHRKDARESREFSQKLKQEIAQLQTRISEADAETSQLRSSYEDACGSIRQLELLVDQTTNKGQVDRDSWQKESEELRQMVDQLTIELSQAKAELSDLRSANEELSLQIASANEQSSAADSQDEALAALRAELNAATERLDDMQRDHQASMNRLVEEREADRSKAAQDLEQALARQRDELQVVESIQQPAQDIAPEQAQNLVESVDSDLVSELRRDLDEIIASRQPDEHQDDSSELRFEGEQQAQDFSHLAEYVNDASDEPANDVQWESESPEIAIDSTINQIESSVDEVISELSAVEQNLTQPETEELQDTEVPQPESSIDESPAEPVEDYQATQTLTEDPAPPEFQQHEPDQPEIETEDPVNAADFQEQGYSEPASEDVVDQAEPEVDQSDPWAAYTEQLQSDTDVEPTAESATSETEDTDEAEQYLEQQETADPGYAAAEDLPQDEPEVADEEPSVGVEESFYQEPADEQPAYDAQPADEQPADEQPADEQPAYDEQVDSESDDVAPDFSSVYDQGPEPDEAYAEPSDDLEQSGFAANEPSAGSLAEMLIRDLGADSDSDEDAGIEQTYMMNDVADHVADSDDATSESTAADWNYDSSGYQFDAQDDQPAEEQSYEQQYDDGANADYQSEYDEAGANHQAEYDEETDASYQSGYDDEAGADANYQSEYQPEDDQQEPEVEESYQLEPTSPQESPERLGATSPDNDSIEAYMNRLLQRVQGDEDDPEAVPSESVAAITPAVGDYPTEVATETQAVTENVEQAEDDGPLIPRSEAPEKNSNLSAMRELANQSARSAVARSVRIQARNTQMRAGLKALYGVIAIGCCAVCYWMLDASLLVKLGIIIPVLIFAFFFFKEGYEQYTEARRRIAQAENPTSQEQPAQPE